eukprot:464607-Prymnesium_polylepis.1
MRARPLRKFSFTEPNISYRNNRNCLSRTWFMSSSMKRLGQVRLPASSLQGVGWQGVSSIIGMNMWLRSHLAANLCNSWHDADVSKVSGVVVVAIARLECVSGEKHRSLLPRWPWLARARWQTEDSAKLLSSAGSLVIQCLEDEAHSSTLASLERGARKIDGKLADVVNQLDIIVRCCITHHAA